MDPRTDHHPFCWGCALGLEGGFGFEWRLEDYRLEAEHAFPERFQGPPGIVHDGLVATLLDEACAQVGRLVVAPAVTSRLEVRYVVPVPVEETLRVSASLVEVGERRATAEASLKDPSGMLLAHAIAELSQVRPEHFLSTPQGRARGLDWLPT